MAYRPHRYKSNLYKSGCLILLLPLLLLACTKVEKADTTTREYIGNSVSIFHDYERDVTCWIYTGTYKGGISCIPDDQLGGINGKE